ncbi:MAG: ATP-binding protein [Parvibaculaceae bacterium]|jgi:signal transduction histidine kinase/HAMP domain-containing protein|nr:ATP-binding protein [Parvibaculaceae bacterium]
MLSISLRRLMPLLALALAMSVIGYQYWYMSSKLSEKQLQDDRYFLAALASQLQNQLSKAIYSADDDLIHEALMSSSFTREIRTALFINSDGNVSHATDFALIGRHTATLPQIDVHSFADIVKKGQAFLDLEHPHHHIVSYTPISLQRQESELRPSRVGWLILEYDTAYGQATLNKTINDVTGKTALFVCILIAALSLLLRYTLTNRMESLLRVTDSIARGNLEETSDLKGRDEFSQIARSINHMARNLNTVQKDLRASQTLLTNAQRLAGLTSWRWDPIGKKMIWSENAEEILGNGIAKINWFTNRIDLDSVHPEDKEIFSNALSDAVLRLKSGTATFRLISASGETKWIEFQSEVDGDVEGPATQIFGAFLDITNLKNAEVNLRELNTNLENRVEVRTQELNHSNVRLLEALDDLKETQAGLIEAEKMASLGGLVAGISHEINTPIGVSVTAISHLERVQADIEKEFLAGTLEKETFQKQLASSQEAVRIVLSNLRRARNLIASFKRVSVDHSSGADAQFDLKTLFDDALLSLSPKLRMTKHKVNLSTTGSVCLEADPGALHQILNNLVMNALLHAFPDIEEGVVSINIDGSGEDVTITFEDNGIGMSPEISARIFEPFFTTKRGQGGSGLGMHIIYNLVTQTLNGKIQCLSTPGKGTRFTICLPGSLRVHATSAPNTSVA